MPPPGALWPAFHTDGLLPCCLPSHYRAGSACRGSVTADRSYSCRYGAQGSGRCLGLHLSAANYLCMGTSSLGSGEGGFLCRHFSFLWSFHVLPSTSLCWPQSQPVTSARTLALVKQSWAESPRGCLRAPSEDLAAYSRLAMQRDVKQLTQRKGMSVLPTPNWRSS